MSNDVAIGRRMKGSETFTARRDSLRLAGGPLLLRPVSTDTAPRRQYVLRPPGRFRQCPPSFARAGLYGAHIGGIAGADHIDIGASGARWIDASGTQTAPFFTPRRRRTFTNCPGQRCRSAFSNVGFQFHRSRGGSIWLSSTASVPLPSVDWLPRSSASYLERLGAAVQEGLAHVAELLLGEREDDGDRLHLIDDDDAVESAARTMLPHRRGECPRGRKSARAGACSRVGSAHCRWRPGRLHERLELLRGVALRVVGLLIDHAIFQQRLIAREHEARVCELGLVLRFFRGSLLVLSLVGAGIDLRELVALLHVLAFLEKNALNLASTRGCTVTLLNACTVPRPSR